MGSSHSMRTLPLEIACSAKRLFGSAPADRKDHHIGAPSDAEHFRRCFGTAAQIADRCPGFIAVGIGNAKANPRGRLQPTGALGCWSLILPAPRIADFHLPPNDQQRAATKLSDLTGTQLTDCISAGLPKCDCPPLPAPCRLLQQWL